MQIIEPLDLNTVKNYLRVSHNIDDAYITTLITTAREFVENYQGRLIAERVPAEGEEAPEYETPTNLEKQAMLLLIYHYYDNRNPVVASTMSEVPLTVKQLLYFHREPEVLQ